MWVRIAPTEHNSSEQIVNLANVYNIYVINDKNVWEVIAIPYCGALYASPSKSDAVAWMEALYAKLPNVEGVSK